MRRRDLLLQGSAASLALATRSFGATREPVIGACEGCEWVFDDQPATVGSRARIAPLDEPGDALVIDGVVSTTRGSPAAGIVVYAYHTDRGGLYPQATNRHGRLKGWAVTDAEGRYRFDTIRPGAYPSRNVPEHVHMHVIEPRVGTYYIDNLEFRDDPLQSATPREEGRGGSGLVLPVRRDGVWHARRDIVLARNISGHPGLR